LNIQENIYTLLLTVASTCWLLLVADTGEADGVEDLRIIQFKEWMHGYGIVYPDQETRRHRFSIFKANVELHGYNTYKEYRAALDDPCYDDLVRSVRPSKIDWVETGVVSPVVRNQYGCGKCLGSIISATTIPRVSNCFLLVDHS
jgi:hypothetical protein